MSVSYAVVVGEGKKMEEQYKQLLKKYDSLLIDHEKLKKEFNIIYKSYKTAIKDAYEWFKKEGYLDA